jgi:hypothetical protein
MNQYETLSVATLGLSTLTNAKNRPVSSYINRVEERFYEAPIRDSTLGRRQTNDVSDIPGAQPRRYREKNYESKILTIDDIDGTRAKIHDKMLHTKRHVNPLQPQYTLPTALIAASEPPPFRKDNLEIDDIEGTRTKHRKVFPGRDTLNLDDIDGTRPGWKPKHM